MDPLTPHGFSWPTGMPACAMCERRANDPIHVTPARLTNNTGPRLIVASANDPVRPHPYVTRSQAAQSVTCTTCGQPLSASIHPVGAPANMGTTVPTDTPAAYSILASEDDEPKDSTPVETFAMEYAGKLVIAAQGNVIPFERVAPAVAADVKAARPASAHLWVAGRYVEADNPNRNAAYWSTADLELGAPSVMHGPVNWLHEARHIIGSIAAAELVRPDPGQGVHSQAASGQDGVGNHIVAISALWPWLYPDEAQVIQHASDDGKLYYSMECIARSVACLEPGCAHGEMDYATYVTEQASRCEHMQAGSPRRFIDPMFLGGAMIVPPVRPGWANADAVVLNAADQAADAQAAAFQGLEHREAAALTANLLGLAAAYPYHP